MSISPLEIQKRTFRRVLRGLDPQEVQEFLGQVAETLGERNARVQELADRAEHLEAELEAARQREQELQRIVVQAQQISDQITANAKRESEMSVREAEVTADKIVAQALEQATTIESRIQELRTRRQELQLKFKNSLELFARILEADIEEEQSTATVHTLQRAEAAAREGGES